MAILNLVCSIRNVSGTDLYGQPGLSNAVSEKCSVVKLRRYSADTSVRPNVSGTGGRAEEFIATHKLLLGNKSVVQHGAQITVGGNVVRVTSIEPRFDTEGTLDHYEIMGEVWA